MVETPHGIDFCFMRAVRCVLQVAAYTSGKDSVSLLDCLLLQHILWQQPDQQARITDFLLSQISEDDGLKSANYILASEPTDLVACT